MPHIGVLALQGAFVKHIVILRSIGVATSEVRTKEDLDRCQGLIIPGGESTTMAKLITHENLWAPLREFATQNPVFGTCAGMILMAKDVIGDYEYPTLRIMDTSVRRNAYGRQVNSFTTELSISFPNGEHHTSKAFFIRAPLLESWSQDIAILASHENTPVLLQQGFHLCASYHPELTDSKVTHKYFAHLVTRDCNL